MATHHYVAITLRVMFKVINHAERDRYLGYLSSTRSTIAAGYRDRRYGLRRVRRPWGWSDRR